MTGTIVIDQPELKFREYDIYRSYYCGLCETLRDSFGQLERFTLSYDYTFLILLLTGLYEPETEYRQGRCIAHPVRKHEIRINEFTAYAADMTILLGFHKCMDDWSDDRKLHAKAFADIIRKKANQLSKRYPRQAEAIKDNLALLSELEAKKLYDIDKTSDTFGRIMAEIVAVKDDEWSEQLHRLGYALGKYIYILDAFEDIEEDIKKGRYNPFIEIYRKDDAGLKFNDLVTSLLRINAGQCARAFEQLPIIENADIIRNILYSGIWSRYNIAVKKREEKEE